MCTLYDKLEKRYDRVWARLYVVSCWDKIKKEGRAITYETPSFSLIKRLTLGAEISVLYLLLKAMTKFKLGASIGE